MGAKMKNNLLIRDGDLHEASHIRLQAHYGMVYIYKNKRVFRGINDDKVEDILALMNSGLIQELIRLKLFPNTQIVDIKLKQYKLVIEHEKIPLRNMFTEWSFDMFKESAKTTLQINKIANKYNYEIRDSHFLNTMFFYGKSMFIDLDSFVIKKSDNWIAYKQFINSYMKLLQLMSLQSNYEYQESVKGMAYYIPNKFYEKIISKDKQYNLNEILSTETLKQHLKEMVLETKTTTWSNYHDDSEYSLESDNRLSKIISQVEKYQPIDIVDLASNAGKFARAILNEVKSVEHIICIDRDHDAINKLFHSIDNTNITPVYNDIVDEYYELLSDRPRAELVLALALTHHLLLSAKYEINFIFELIGSYSNRYVFIEFMPLGLYGGDLEKIPKIPDWYNEEWFESNFKGHFRLLHKEKIEINRILFVGEKL